MKLQFKQGIARHQTDVNGNPTFLQRSTGSGTFVDLVVSPDPTVLLFAHRAATYVVEEVKTILKAWGPITTPATRYLYWDLNLLTGALTRGMTLFPPIYASGQPPSPALDQHWFDTDENVMRVYTNQGWSERVRLFAGQVTSGSIIRPERIGSQAGLIGDFEGGHVVLDSFGKPLRESNGCFVTSASHLNIVNMSTITTRLEGTISSVMASEELPAYHLVWLRRGGRAVLARSGDRNSRIAGLVNEDLYEGEVGKLISHGVVRSSLFTWPESAMNKPLYCGPAGEITLMAPSQGVLQKVGFVYDTDAIYLNIHAAIILDSPDDLITPPGPPPVSAPVANFTASVVSGLAPLTVDYTSIDTGATLVEWDFVNDGFIDASGQTASYTYAAPGVYTVRQRVTNSFGVDEEVKVNFITVSAPSTGPNTNLGLSFGAPFQIQGGLPFSFQVTVSNDGLADATNVLRQLTIRANNNTQVTVIAPPAGVVVTYTGSRTQITLPLIANLASGNAATITLQAQTQTNVNSIQLEGTVSSPETDATLDDNVSTLTIEVRP